ncbi:MAG TPA: glutamine amidotransferase [Trichormus sp.]
MRKQLRIITIVCTLFICSISQAMARPTKVLLVTGDWKSQQWYQDVVMGGKQKYRGRFIEQKVNEAAPGQFAFTEMTNYAGQEYIDANVLSQYDVVLFGDVAGSSIPAKTIEALKQFVTNGGGFIYCASYKWNTCLVDCSLPDVLPVSFRPAGTKGDDWWAWKIYQPEEHFKPVAKLAEHPIAKGLNWNASPPLDKAFVVVPRAGTQVVLTTPKGAPLLVAGNIGRGRTICSASIFANDEVSPDFCQKWPDIGRFYAQTFKWLAAESKNEPRTCQAAESAVEVTVDATKKENAITPSLFGFNSTLFPPNLGKLEGTSLKTFERLQATEALTRFGSSQLNFEPKRGQFNFTTTDQYLAECERLHLKPEIVTDSLLFVPWIFNGGSLATITDAQIKDCCDWIAALLQHTNHGTGSTPGYKPVVEYLEVGNEPCIDSSTIRPYIRVYTAVADRIHKEFPGVKLGALGAYELPYVNWFLDGTKGKIDFLARHPYGWTPDMLFKMQDNFQTYCKSKGYPAQHFCITEWDFWIAGAPKFDYIMKRTFGMVKRTDLIGTMHYRLDQYPEPVYNFGAIWAGFGPGTGKRGLPMTDAYDPYELFNRFRGSRATTSVACPDARLAEHIYADSAITSSGDITTVVYYDHGYDGNGFTDFAGGKQYTAVKATLTIKLPPQSRQRALTIRTSTGEGVKEDPTTMNIMPNQTQVKVNVTLHPHQGTAITIGA